MPSPYDPLSETRSDHSTDTGSAFPDPSGPPAATSGDDGRDGRLHGMLRPSHLRDEVWPAMRTRLGDGGHDLARTARRHPVPLALIGAGLGWWAMERATGLALPTSRLEDEKLGTRRDHLLDQARRAGREAVAKGAHVAEEATASAREALERSKASEQGLGERLKAASEEARRAARQVVREVGFAGSTGTGTPAETSSHEGGSAAAPPDPSATGIGGTLEPSGSHGAGPSLTSGRSHAAPGSSDEGAASHGGPPSPAAPSGGSISAERGLQDPSRRRSDDETPG